MKYIINNNTNNNNNNNNNNNIRGPTMQCKDKRGGTKRVAGLYTNKRRCYKHYGEKMSGPESSPTELSTEMAFLLCTALKVAARGTGGPSTPQNAALFCG